MTVFCDVADWIDDSCIIGVDQSSIRPEDGSNRFLRTSVNCHQNQGFTFQKMAVIVTTVMTSNYFIVLMSDVNCCHTTQFSCFPVSAACFKINNWAFLNLLRSASRRSTLFQICISQFHLFRWTPSKLAAGCSLPQSPTPFTVTSAECRTE